MDDAKRSLLRSISHYPLAAVWPGSQTRRPTHRTANAKHCPDADFACGLGRAGSQRRSPPVIAAAVIRNGLPKHPLMARKTRNWGCYVWVLGNREIKFLVRVSKRYCFLRCMDLSVMQGPSLRRCMNEGGLEVRVFRYITRIRVEVERDLVRTVRASEEKCRFIMGDCRYDES